MKQLLKVSAHETATTIVLSFDDLPAQFEMTNFERTDDRTNLMPRGVIKDRSGYAATFKDRRGYPVIRNLSLGCVSSSDTRITAQPGNTIHVWPQFPAARLPDQVSVGWGNAQPTNGRITK